MTPRHDLGAYLTRVVPDRRNVCDYCVNVAYDEGIQGYDAQAEAMVMLGADLEDHLCDQNETDGEVKCACGCPKRG